MGPDHGGGRSASFSQELSELKREGCNLLVVGVDCEGAHATACQRLLGDDTPERRRLFAVIESAGVDRCRHVPTDPVEGVDRMIVRNLEDDHPNVNRPIPTIHVDTRLLSVLGAEINVAIDEFEQAEQGLEPAQLRFCFDSLGTLFAQHDSQTMFRLLHLVTARIRQVSGMGHFHLRVNRDDDHVKLLEPLFDAVVELRQSDDSQEQRWYIHDKGIESDWISI